jgi:hypothetical protein
MTASANGSAATGVVKGRVICTVPSYCGRGAPGGGIWVYTTPTQSGRTVGDVFSPDQYESLCQTTGSNVNATPWGGRNTNAWVKIKFPSGQQNYIPYAWFTFDVGQGALGNLPGC